MWIMLVIMGMAVIWLCYGMVPTCYYRYKERKARKENDYRHLFLSFDDGVDSVYTKELLNLLLRHGIHATFFVVAKFAQKNQGIIKRMQEEGHCIGLHSLRHESALLKTPRKVRQELEESLCIMNNLGVKITLYRPPWGHCNLSLLHELKKHDIKLALWNVMAEDWRGDITSRQIADKLLSRTASGDILCLHDGRGTDEAPKRTVEALTSMLALWVAQGYSFLRMDEKYE